MGARTRSHAHGERRGRLLIHFVVVLLATSAITFASQYPKRGAAIEPVLPTFAYSGVAGTARLSENGTYLRASTSLLTHESAALLVRAAEPITARAVGVVAPTSSLSSGVSAAAAVSSASGTGVTPLAEQIDPTAPYVLHETRPGDTISAIAARYGVSIKTILENNPTAGDGELIRPGEQIIVPREDGILHKVAYGESPAEIVGQYDNISVETLLAYRPNGITDPKSMEPGKMVLLVGAKQKPPPPPPPAPVAAGPGPGIAAPAASGGRFSNPLGGYQGVSDAFGTNRGGGTIHTGIDLDLYGRPSSPIFSSCDGTVTRTEWLTYSYGYYVVVDCGDGFTTLYAHMSRIDVSVGQRVRQGAVLGLSGLTGYTTGEHLHFEIRYQGAPVNPAAYIGF